jgi:uncharacterized protein (TIGR00255 family)
MTGFAREQAQAPWGALTWELKSVNHRYLEMSFRLPEMFRRFEPQIRALAQRYLNRGKLDITLKFSPGEQVPYDIVVNEALASKLAAAQKKLAKNYDAAQCVVSMTDVLNWPGVLSNEACVDDTMSEQVLSSLETALKTLSEMRSREGAGLNAFLQTRLDQVDSMVAQLAIKLPEIMDAQRTRLLTRFEELQVSLDPDRLEQEMVLLLQKADVAEELHRLEAHTKEVRSVLERDEAIGRRLDFLMQELNREANTLGSKAIDTTVSNTSIEIKVLIEQMREQVQNIE